MNAGKLWTMRYRQGHTGVKFSYLEANNRAHAEAKGRQWCREEPGRLYLAVEPGVLEPETFVPDPEAPQAETRAYDEGVRRGRGREAGTRKRHTPLPPASLRGPSYRPERSPEPPTETATADKPKGKGNWRGRAS